MFGVSKVSLESPFHLSYPYSLQYSGNLVMVPEHSESEDLSLYRVDQNGVASEKESIGPNMRLLDSTIVRFNDKYWLFATHPGADENTNLYIYYSNDLEAPWSMHAQNPVKRDISNARPAGQFIFHDGKMFRPAQDCRKHYGSGIIVNEVKTLNENAFEELPVSEIRPEVGSRYEYGLHTISSAGDYTVVDGARLQSLIHPSLDGLGKHLLKTVRA